MLTSEAVAPSEGLSSRSAPDLPLSVIAVVTSKKLVFVIWGDDNGNEYNKPLIGETSIALARACLERVSVEVMNMRRMFFILLLGARI
ncbi:hypothetical protein GQ53DRAFT_264981 [Thozetella sp. PMI_491]|nr:hypothetical protein GQ53DRAFT_264981 [Thozetella sp. PMI_491]